MSDKKIRLLIVDDHAFFRQGVQLFLDGVEGLQLVGEANNGQEALKKMADLEVDVVLMDLQMPGMDGIETTRKIQESWPGVKVLVLTSFNSWDKVYEALQAGACGYVLKDARPEELIAAVQAVAAGGNYFGDEIAQELLKRITRGKSVEEPDLPEPLTDREMDVLKLIGRGLGNQEIADELVVSIKTVKTHVTNIFGKLEVNSRTQAAIYAMRRGLV